MLKRTRAVVVVASVPALLAGTSLIAGPASAAQDTVKQVNQDHPLISAKGVTLAPNGAPVVAQGFFGNFDPVLKYAVAGAHKGHSTELTDPIALTDISARNGGYWAITSFGGDPQAPPSERGGHLVRIKNDGTVKDVVDLIQFAQDHPDPNNVPPEEGGDGTPDDSNPYGLATAPNGDALVTDAAANSLLRVEGSGDVRILARFTPEVMSTANLPPDWCTEGGETEAAQAPVDCPDSVKAEYVPTTVTDGVDNAAYVGGITGNPFEAGKVRIWRVPLGSHNAQCSNDPAHYPAVGNCTVYASGLTAVQDIAFGANGKALYVLELAKEGWGAFESGTVPGALIKVKRHGRTEIAEGQITQPGGIAISENKIFVTDNMFGEGRLLQIKD